MKTKKEGRRDKITVRERALLVRFIILNRAFLSVDVYVEIGPTRRSLLIHSGRRYGHREVRVSKRENASSSFTQNPHILRP